MKKFLPYILILLVLVGTFGSPNKIRAEDPMGVCKVVGLQSYPKTEADCRQLLIDNPTYKTKYRITWTGQDGIEKVINDIPATDPTAGGATTNPAGTKTPFENAVSDAACGAFTVGVGCIVKLLYYILYLPSTFLLYLAAKFFNALIAISLNSKLLTDSFVLSAWGVVRDLSNIFFILILLYVAIKIILDLGGHDSKQAIVKVIIIALLINFSMFFTQIVVDSSNVLALIFYNKLNVTGKNGQPINNDSPATGPEERNLSGAMYYSFNPTKLLDTGFFEKAKNNPKAPSTMPGSDSSAKDNEVAPGILIGIIIIASAIMIFATYCFFASGIYFVGRLIELFILIIFSPFAFMSFTIPELKKTDYVGWDAWTHRLLTVAFMAPIFMFFMYFIFKLLKADLFSALIPGSDMIQTILGVVIPAMLILILLLKATEFAKKGAGTIGEMVMTGAKLAGGLALGAVTGGAALLGTKVIGGFAAGQLARKGEDWKEKANEGGLGGYAAKMALKTTTYGTKATFDARKAPGIGKLAAMGGMNLSSNAIGLGPKEGGHQGAADRTEKKLKEERDSFKTGKTDQQVRDWSKKKQEEYEKDKQEEVAKGKITAEEYEKKHPKPKDYSQMTNAADVLNHDRQQAYQENIGKTGLLASVAHEAVKRTTGFVDKDNWKEGKNYERYAAEYSKKHGKGKFAEWDEEIAKNVNNGRINTAKMVIGAGATIATGGLGGGLAGLGLGTVGVAVGMGAVAGTGYVGDKLGIVSSKEAGRAQFAEGVAKEDAKMKKISERMDANTKALDKLNTLLEGGKSLDVKDEEGNPVKDIVTGTGKKEDPYVVDQDKLEKALANLVFLAKKKDLELKKLIDSNQGDSPKAKAIQVELVNNTILTATLQKLKTAERDIENLNKQNYEYAKDRSAASQKPKEEKKDSGNTPHAPTSKTPSSSVSKPAPTGPKHS